jgi:anti-sigma factor RsiW
MSREFDELLSAYLDGEVSPEERAAVERRLEQSPALRETLDELSEVGDLIRSLPLARAPVDLPERVVAAIAPAPLASTTQAQKKRRLFGTWPLMAAGSVLAAGVAIVVLLPRQPANLADGLAFTEKRFGTEAATAGESGGRRGGLAPTRQRGSAGV